MNGEWMIKMQPGDVYIIIFASNEGEIQTIPNFKHEDLMKLVDLEIIIDGRIEYINLGLRDIVEKIEGYADKYSDNPERILDVAACWSCDSILVELACNFTQFFVDLITETKNTFDEEQHDCRWQEVSHFVSINAHFRYEHNKVNVHGQSEFLWNRKTKS